MTVSFSSFRPARWGLFTLMFFAALVALVPSQNANAQGPNAKNMALRNDGTTFVISKTTRNFAPSHSVSTETNITAQQGTLRNLPAVRPQSPESVIGPDGRTQVTNTADYPTPQSCSWK